MDDAFLAAFKSFEPNIGNNITSDTCYIDCNLNDKSSNNDMDTAQEHKEQKLDIKSCKSMERISQILTYYISWINTIESNQTDVSNTPSIGMFDIINSTKYLGNYSNTHLLNDFHHLLHSHSYHTIHTLFTPKNDKKSKHKHCVHTSKICTLLHRNYRNRNIHASDNRQRLQTYFNYTQSTEITTQQILDYIHSFIYHSYDLGFKLTPVCTTAFDNHLSNYQNQLIDQQNIEYSKTPNPPMFRQQGRGSILYNQKIDVNALKISNDPSNSGTDSEESEDSLSVTPQPPSMDVGGIEIEEKKSDSFVRVKMLTPTSTPLLSPTSTSKHSPMVSKSMNSMILSTPQPMQNIDETHNESDSKLLQHIKLSNSKIVIIKQIMDEINDKKHQMCRKLMKITQKCDEKSAKFIHVLTSYKHLLYQFEAENGSKSEEITTRHRKTSSADQRSIAPKPAKMSHSKSKSLAKFARMRSETEGIFKTKNFLKRNKKRTKTEAKLSEANDTDLMVSPRSKYVNDSVNDTTNAGLTFDFGVRYYYWGYYKNNNNKDREWNHGMKYKHLYIEPRQNGLKFEMLNLSSYNAKNSNESGMILNKKSNIKTKLFAIGQAKNKLSLKESASVKDENEAFECKDSNEVMTVCGMSMEQWNDIEQRAHDLFRTRKCKEMKCDLSIWSREYGISEGESIGKEHIMSVLIFCTFNRIRNEFVLTFNQYYNTAVLFEDMIKQKKNKTKNNKHLFDLKQGIEAMKINHSSFANFARLLRESIECFGKRLNDSKSFYFGINNALALFQRTLSQFKLPLLCSQSMNVVLNYMSSNDNIENEGLLIEMKYYSPFIRYFDCSFLTEFGCIEDSTVFMGGISMLKIETIYSIFDENNYKNFIRSINILQSMLMGKMKQETMTENEEQIIRYLVQNEFIRSMNNDTDLENNVNGNGIIPKYISLLFHHFCINLKLICINLHRMNDRSFYGYHSIKSLFLTSQNNFIKLDVLCSLFPNVPLIKIIGDHSDVYNQNNSIKLDRLFFEEVLLIFDSNLISNKCALNKIVIAYANEANMTLEQAIVQYQSQFAQKNCVLKIKVKTRELIIERTNVNNKYISNRNNSKTEEQACLIQ